jgi:hypothetical protein
MVGKWYSTKLSVSKMYSPWWQTYAHDVRRRSAQAPPIDGLPTRRGHPRDLTNPE